MPVLPLHCIAECNTVLADTQLAGGDLQVALQGVASIQTCYTACLNANNCAAFSYTPATQTCALKDIANWMIRPLAGTQSAVVCPEPFPGKAEPPSPPGRCAP